LRIFYQPLNAIPTQPDTSYTYDVDNRMLTAGSTTFNYDNNGNLITKTSEGNVTNYSWDFNDMLTQVTNGSNTYIYRYDGLGSRMARIENSTETRYVGGLAETDASGNITAYYVYGLGLISKITPSNEAYYYHYDGIGSTVGMSDSLGAMVNKYAYDAFGKVLNEEETIPNPFKYVGQYGVMDEGNGLLYMRARYYDPEVGRFISKDPIGFLGGDINLYPYVANNPVNLIDPEGTKAFLYHFIDGYRVGRLEGKGIWESLKFGNEVMQVDRGENADNPRLHANAAFRGESPAEAIAAASQLARKNWNEGNKALAVHAWGDIGTEKGVYYPGFSNDPIASAWHMIKDVFKWGSFKRDIKSNLGCGK